MTCTDKKCLFHKDICGCHLSEKQNFFVTDKQGKVYSCINRIYKEKDLSTESKKFLRSKGVKI